MGDRGGGACVPPPKLPKLLNLEQLVSRGGQGVMGEAIGEVVYRGGWEREITITVGCEEEQRQFRGRRDLLAEQSGYFKSLLDSRAGEEVAVPGVSPEAFARILQFVHTGLLDLTPDNIYSVLLATHLLHMPKALELCRSYLVLERHRLLSSPPPPSIVKPIPSRKYFFWPQPPPFFPLPPPPHPHPHYASSLYVHPTPAAPLQLGFEPLPSTSVLQSSVRELPAAPGAASPPLPEAPAVDDEKTDKGVHKDIACCDGPVRFKRVLNLNYGSGLGGPEERETSSAKDGGGDLRRRRLFACTFCNHTFKSHYCFRKHTRRHLNPVPLEAPAAARLPQDDAKDMNVQYYPCKTCGSKFPSYYFVHKHRKMVHGADHYSDSNKPPTPTATSEHQLAVE